MVVYRSWHANTTGLSESLVFFSVYIFPPLAVQFGMDYAAASESCEDIVRTVQQAVVCERSFLETVLVGLLSRGHVLLEDTPGTGKTLTARTIATALGVSFSRIQFTPDLLPSDITGTHIFNEKTREFEFNEGPLFANVVLADEINRAPPKTQSALLEAMEEGQVSVGSETYDLPEPFFLIATQNPIEYEGTFPLPEAQVDRFLVKTSLGYPSFEEEMTLLRRRSNRNERSPTIDSVLLAELVSELQAVPESIHVDDDVLEYMLHIARGTRSDHRVEVGISPRGSQRLFEASRARAVIEGREYVTPDTVTTIAQPVLAHRLVLTGDARVDGVTKEEIIDDILAETAVPTVE
jgi:MoxR-like ATPase